MIEAVWHGRFEPLCHIGLKNVTRQYSFDDFVDHPFIAGPGEIAGPAIQRNHGRRRGRWGIRKPCLEEASALHRAALTRWPVRLGKTRREDKAAPLDQIQGNDNVVKAERKIGESEPIQSGRGKPFQTAAKFIGEQARGASLKRRQSGQRDRPIGCQLRF